VIRAVLFDFGGTLDADGIPWKSRFARLCADERLLTTREQFDSAFYTVDDALVGAVPSTLSLADTVSRLACGLAGALGSSDESAGQRIAERFLADARRHFERNAPILKRLSRRFRLGIVSNFYGNLATVCHDAGINELCGAIIDSTHVGCLKPDPLIFKHALDALAVTPAEAIFVGDSVPRDMAGARAVGMPHAWLVGERSTPSEPCCEGDPTLRSLTELESILS
jgi:putative hydrolase of the HAD superfamily